MQKNTSSSSTSIYMYDNVQTFCYENVECVDRPFGLAHVHCHIVVDAALLLQIELPLVYYSCMHVML